MINTAIITNIPAPYSIDLFKSIQERHGDISLSIVFSAMSRKNRIWAVDLSAIKNVYSLESRIIERKAGNGYIRYIHIPKGTWKTLKQISPSVLLVYEYSMASVIALLWAKFHRCAFVHITEGTLLSEKGIGIAQRLLRKIIIKNSDHYVGCSTKSTEKLKTWGADEKNIDTILLTIDSRKYLTLRDDPSGNNKNLLYVGSIEEGKGIDLLVKALKYVEKNVRLRLVGNGSKEYVEEIKQIARQVGVSDQICFLGYLEGSDLLREYSQSSLFVFPTRNDCFGLVLVEAYCSGLPIVSSKYADGAYDVIVDGENGLIIDPYNVMEFGNAIMQVLRDKRYSIKANQTDARKFDINYEADCFADVIRKATNQKE